MKRWLARIVAAAWVWSGLAGLARRHRRRRGDFRVFILEYHGVVESRAGEGKVSLSTLRRHLAWLLAEFGTPVTVSEAAARLRAGPLDRDCLAITFDDGYADNAELAFPVLREAGAPATVYLATGFLDGEPLWFDVARRALRDRALLRPNPPLAEREVVAVLGPSPPPLEPAMRLLKDAPAAARLAAVKALAPFARASAARPMSWDQARELQEAGWELGAHTVSHPILSRLDAGAQREEIAASRARIDEELGPRPRSFAMPNGGRADYDDTTLAILAELGFVAACTTRRGGNRPGDDLYQLRRLGVGEEPPYLLEARLAGLFDEDVRRRLGVR